MLVSSTYLQNHRVTLHLWVRHLKCSLCFFAVYLQNHWVTLHLWVRHLNCSLCFLVVYLQNHWVTFTLMDARNITETIFLDPVVHQGTTFNEKWEKAIIDVKTHFKRETFQHIHFYLLSPTNCKKMDLTNKKPWEPDEKTPPRKYFRFRKAVDGQRVATLYWKKNCY